jgi:hypothetical protein
MRNYKFLIETDGEMFTETFYAATVEEAAHQVVDEYEGGRFALVGTSAKYQLGRKDGAIKPLMF